MNWIGVTVFWISRISMSTVYMCFILTIIKTTQVLGFFHNLIKDLAFPINHHLSTAYQLLRMENLNCQKNKNKH